MITQNNPKCHSLISFYINVHVNHLMIHSRIEVQKWHLERRAFVLPHVLWITCDGTSISPVIGNYKKEI